MGKILSLTGHNDVNELCNQLKSKLQSLNASDEAKIVIDDCILIADTLNQAHRAEYKRICNRFDKEVYGDIMCTKRGSSSEVESIGVDGLKTIVFEEMGFNADDRLELNQ